MNSIYVLCTKGGPHYLVGAAINPLYYNKVLETMKVLEEPRSINLKEIKRVPYNHLLRVVSFVSLVKTSLYPDSLTCYRETISKYDLFNKSFEYSLLIKLRRLRALLNYPSTISVRTSVPITYLEEGFVLKNDKPLDYSMLIAYSLCKVLYEETNM